MTDMPAAKPAKINPLLKLSFELGPLVLFFITYARFDVFVGTAVFMVAVVVAFAASYALTRHIPLMAIVSAVIVMVFGGLTLVFQNEMFIKLKPTVIYALFGSVLLGGLAFGKPLLAVVFDSVFNLTEEGWRKLTLRWALFFFALAVINEIVWRTQTTGFWLGFKGVAVALTFVFAAFQYPLLMKYDASPKPTEADASE